MSAQARHPAVRQSAAVNNWSFTAKQLTVKGGGGQTTSTERRWLSLRQSPPVPSDAAGIDRGYQFESPHPLRPSPSKVKITTRFAFGSFMTSARRLDALWCFPPIGTILRLFIASARRQPARRSSWQGSDRQWHEGQRLWASRILTARGRKWPRARQMDDLAQD